jgi:hypothetical protein
LRAQPGAIERQAKLIGFDPTDCPIQAIAAIIAGNEEATVVARHGHGITIFALREGFEFGSWRGAAKRTSWLKGAALEKALRATGFVYT